MKHKPRWHNHPGWYLVVPIAPLLIFVTFEDEVFTRFLLAFGLALAAGQYGRETAKRARGQDRRKP